MSQRVKSQNLSVMMTDIQGYSSRSAQSSREETIQLIRRHNKLMVPVIEFYGGTVIKTIGDAFLCTFPSATDAVICGIIIQLLLKEYNQHQQDINQKLNLRVVVNSGDVTLEEGDIFGDAVNITARMEGLPCFPGGSIGVSEITFLLMDRGEIVAEKVGPQMLKGIPDPVTVYRVPLDKQKLTSLPVNLLSLVKNVVDAKDESSFSAQIENWKGSVSKFLKEKNWGEQFNQLGQGLGKGLGKVQEKLGQNLGVVQKQLAQTFGQKTILEKKEGRSLNDAGILTRFKSGLIDLAIIIVIAVLFRIAWWPVQRVVFGSASLSSAAFYDLSYADQKNYRLSDAEGDGNYYRKFGWIEFFADFNIRWPFFPVFLYLGVFWWVKGATLGQIAAHTAVLTEGGKKPDLRISFLRSALFMVSLVFFGIGMFAIFFGDRRTFYDKFCETRVVE